jgi:crossover junction endodeoxyribonuclease RuvC
MRILGIDPGTGRTGWGIIHHKEADTVEYIAHGCIVTPSEDLMQNRLLALYKELGVLISKFSPDCIVVEHIFFGLNARTAISVSQARGVVMLSCAEVNLPLFEYTSLAVKHIVAGSGKTDKKEMQRVVRTLLKLDDKVLAFSAKDKAFDDSADALAIAIHHVWKVCGKDKEILALEKERKKNEKETFRNLKIAEKKKKKRRGAK